MISGIAVLLVVATCVAHAQQVPDPAAGYPNKTIRILVGFSF